MGRRTDAEHLENRVRELRRSAGLSQGELAKLAGITRQAVSAIEAGQYLPNTAVALRLARALGQTVEDLFSISDISQKISSRPGSAIGEWSDSEGQRVQLARVGDDLVAMPLSGADGFLPADGVSKPPERDSGGVDVELLVEPATLEQTAVVLGCDPSLGLLAEHVHRSTRDVRILWRHAGSLAALRALAAGEAHIAGTHLWDPETGESNLPAIRRELAGRDVVVIALSQWQQGLMVASGNPKSVRDVADLARPDVSIVNREAGAGSRVLLDYHLEQAGVPTGSIIGYERLRASHSEIAAAVKSGVADAGTGILASARAYGLDFIPLHEERYDLVVPAEFLNTPTVQTLLNVAVSSASRAEVETLGGYDTSMAGTVISESPA